MIKIRTDTIANLALQHIQHKTKMQSTTHRKSQTALFKLSVVLVLHRTVAHGHCIASVLF